MEGARKRKVRSALLFPLIVLLWNYLVVVSKAQTPDLCTDRYAVVNLWKEFDIVDYFCYLSWSFCEFRYYPPGTLSNSSFNGDNEPGFSPFVFNFGGVVRSNFQQDYRAFPNFQNPVGMPRPPDAGRFFAPHFSFAPETTEGYTETCGILALSEEATLTFQYQDQCPETITVGRYEAIQKELTFTGKQNVTIRVTSTAPIIISCLRQETTDFYTWQPISSEPVFIFLKDVTESIAVTLSDCETNDEIKDINRVKLEYGYLQANGECNENVENSSSNAFTFGVGSTSCGVYIVPVDNETCVSAVKSFNTPNPSRRIMGQALSKGVTQFGNLPFFDADVLIFSNSDQNCKYLTVDTIENVETVIDSNWTGELASKLQLERIPNNDFYILECSQPVLLIDNGELSHSFQSLGRQAEEAWKPFFIAEGCEV